MLAKPTASPGDLTGKRIKTLSLLSWNYCIHTYILFASTCIASGVAEAFIEPSAFLLLLTTPNFQGGSWILGPDLGHYLSRKQEHVLHGICAPSDVRRGTARHETRFVDAEFMPTDSSLFEDPTHQNHPPVIWKRPEDFCKGSVRQGPVHWARDPTRPPQATRATSHHKLRWVTQS